MDQFLNFDKLKVDVFKEFGYDLNGCDDEIKVMAYVCQAACNAKTEVFKETIADSLKQYTTISESFTLGFKSGIDILVSHLDNKQILINNKTDELFSEQKKKLEQEVLLLARKSIAIAFDENGISLNTKLSSVITEFKTVSEDAKYKTQSISKSLKNIGMKFIIYSGVSCMLSTACTFILLLYLQNSGIIKIPLNVNLNAKSVAEYIIKSIN